MTDTGFWRGRRCLVTGATGFLGGWMTRGLLDAGADVTALVRRRQPQSQFVRGGLAERCRIVEGDMSDRDTIAAAFDGGLDTVFHIGALSDVQDATVAPALCLETNILSALRLLEHVRASSPTTAVVMSSSDKAYGPQAVPYRESQLLAPHHPYEVSKAAQDHIAQSYGRVFGVKVAVTRCANFYGGWDENFKRIIPGVIASVIAGEPVILRSDGKFTRDFIYIEDAVAAKMLLAEKLHEDESIAGEAFNFSYEVDIEIIEIVKKICSMMGATTDITVNNDAKQEIRYMAVNADKARKRLNWKPQFDFDTGMRRTIDWYRSNIVGDAAVK